MNLQKCGDTRRGHSVWKLRSYIVTLLLIPISFMSIVLACPTFVFADTPAVVDFGQNMSTFDGHSVDKMENALFVTKSATGGCRIESRAVVDDAIIGFAGEHPAWQLNVPLTWYFMEPVYERNLSTLQEEHGRISV